MRRGDGEDQSKSDQMGEITQHIRQLWILHRMWYRTIHTTPWQVQWPSIHSFRYRRQACIQMESRSVLKRTISWIRWKKQIHQNSYVILYLFKSILYIIHSFNWEFNRDIESLTFITSFNSNKHHSYSNMWTRWVRNEQSPKPLWRRTCISSWQIRYMANSWRQGWNEWKWSLPTLGMNVRLSSRNMDMIWSRNYHVFRKFDRYQIEYTCKKSCKTILHRVCHSDHVQTHHIRFLLQRA